MDFSFLSSIVRSCFSKQDTKAALAPPEEPFVELKKKKPSLVKWSLCQTGSGWQCARYLLMNSLNLRSIGSIFQKMFISTWIYS